jgi:WD40 repeat protein
MLKMNKIKIFSLIAVFTALFIGCEEPNDGTDSPTGGGNGGTEVDYTKFKCLKTLEGDSEGVLSVAYSPDGTKIISGSEDNTIKIWDANTGECLKTLEGHSGWVRSVAFSPDGTKIISGSFDDTIKIWGEE